MGIIQCSHDCIYQLDGYCYLEEQTIIDNPCVTNGISCVYYKQRNKNAKSDAIDHIKYKQ